jgi:hypothetical protein
VNRSDAPVIDVSAARHAGCRWRARLGSPALALPAAPVTAIIATWLVAVCAGLAFLASHANRAGAAGTAPPAWPASSPLARSGSRATLVVALHPGCPCSRATIEELGRLMARDHDRLTVHALVLKPSGFGEDWEKTDLWHAVAAIPDVTLHRDVDGLEAKRFGAATSGQVVLYDADGRLAFSGGITPSRGHAGDSAGARTIAAALDGATARGEQTPVFGCSLDDAAAAGRAE